MDNRLSDNGKYNDKSFFALLDYELEQYAQGREPSEPSVFAARRLQSRMAKKYCPEGVSNRTADERAIDEFLFIQHEIRKSSRKINIDPVLLGEMQSFIYYVLERAHREFAGTHVAGETADAYSIFTRWGTGPGTGAETSYSHFVEKLGDNTVTYSGNAYLLLPLLADISPDVWGRFIDPHSYTEVLEVEGSEGACVSKTPEISRFIGKQPTVNMAGQLALGSWIADALKLIGLDISVQQDKNIFLAFMASVAGDSISAQRMCTVDLKSATDWNCLELMGKLFDFDDGRFLTLLNGVRETRIKIDGHTYELGSYSTMGNGYTFALMTLIMSAAVYAVGRVNLGWGRHYIPWDEVGIFGDDLICRTELYLPLCELLESMGYKVNKDKSFATGYFRESCGGDFYHGCDVTPFYIKDLQQVSDRLIALNQLIGWMARNKIYLWQSFYYLVDWIPAKYRNLVPSWEADYSGIRTTEPLRAYTKARLRTIPRVTHAAPAFKLAAVLGGYAIAEYNVNRCVNKTPYDPKITGQDYRGVELTPIELELQEYLYEDPGRIIYTPRDCATKYALTHVKANPHSSLQTGINPERLITKRGVRLHSMISYSYLLGLSFTGWRRYCRRTVEVERLAYIASLY